MSLTSAGYSKVDNLLICICCWNHIYLWHLYFNTYRINAELHFLMRQHFAYRNQEFIMKNRELSLFSKYKTQNVKFYIYAASASNANVVRAIMKSLCSQDRNITTLWFPEMFKWYIDEYIYMCTDNGSMHVKHSRGCLCTTEALKSCAGLGNSPGLRERSHKANVPTVRQDGQTSICLPS